MSPGSVFYFRALFIPVLVFAAINCFAAATYGQVEKCLQSGVTLQTPVRYTNKTVSGGRDTSRPVTVKQELSRLHARCSRGVLKVPSGKKIRFFQLQGCWGNPPANYLEILNDQSSEIAELKRKFVVVELTCESGGVLRN